MDEAFIKKVQPNSPEAEQSVIGAMIMDRDAIADVIDIVNADDFYQKQNGILFEAMTELCQTIRNDRQGKGNTS